MGPVVQHHDTIAENSRPDCPIYFVQTMHPHAKLLYKSCGFAASAALYANLANPYMFSQELQE
jgi:hypothetical protein